MFVAACFCGLASLPVVAGEDWDWDDFSNNLATDLAPILSLFGEQITKQYLSESINIRDYFIFAMAPIGIMTAIVSTIRVCGSPSLRAFVGRAQEGGGNAEAELCSSTSRDVCELYNNGGIARVFGRPKILEFIYKEPPSENKHFINGKPPSKFQRNPGIYTFPEYIEFQGNLKDNKNKWVRCKDKWFKRHWKRRKDMEAARRGQDPRARQAFAPNLSLNVGIQKRHAAVFGGVAALGFILQAGVLVLAVVVSQYGQFEKDGKRPERYAWILFVFGTPLLCGGMFHCAFLIGHSTDEEVWHKKQSPNTPSTQQSPKKPSTQQSPNAPSTLQNSNKSSTQQSPNTSPTIFWAQPGQVLGDQTFDPFTYNDSKSPLQEYITSWKKESKGRELQVWLAVGATISGFVLQFVGLRGIHSAVSLAQLGAMMIMSAARAALRMQRLRPEDNCFNGQPDLIKGHELDWLALLIGKMSIQKRISQEDRNQRTSTPDSPVHLWRFCGVAKQKDRLSGNDPTNGPSEGSSDGARPPNNTERILGYRTRLAQMTRTVSSHGSANNFEIHMVAVRSQAEQLANALESAIDKIFLESAKVKDEWAEESATTMWVAFLCDVYEDPSTQPDDSTPEGDLVHLEFSRKEDPRHWKIRDREKLEGLLGLWFWSLNSDPLIEGSNTESGSAKRLAVPIAAQRIVATDQSIQNLQVWLGGLLNSQEKDLRLEGASFGKPGSVHVWKPEESTWDPLQSHPAENPRPSSPTRFFGWFAAELPQGIEPSDAAEQPRGPKPWKVRSVPTKSSLLSLCAQEVFGSFVKSVLDVVDDVGQPDIQTERQPFRLENRLVTELVHLFIESGLGPREDALLCVLPPTISRLSRSSAENALVAARDSAKWNRERHEWTQAETVLKWAWECASTDAQIQRRTAIALGETYRWALQDDKAKAFGLAGIEWLKATRDSRPLSEPVNEIIDRYDKIGKSVEQREDFSGSSLSTMIDKGLLAEALTYLTLPTMLAEQGNEKKGKALCSAAKQKHGWTEVVLTLLELGAEVDFKDEESSRTALSYSAENGSVDTFKILMNARAFPNSADAARQTPLSYASANGHSFIVELLIRDPRVDPNFKHEDERTPLSWAAENGHAAIVKLLLQTGKVDVAIPDKRLGRTPLWFAAISGHEAIVKLLLETGKVEVETPDKYGRTPLSWAAGNGHEAVVKLLLKTGKVELDPRDENERTPLSYAAESGHEAVVKLLLESGKADVDAREKDIERTPLSYAAGNGYETVVKLLIEIGKADVDARDRYRQTPLQLAKENGHEAVVKLLQNRTSRLEDATEAS